MDTLCRVNLFITSSLPFSHHLQQLTPALSSAYTLVAHIANNMNSDQTAP